MAPLIESRRVTLIPTTKPRFVGDFVLGDQNPSTGLIDIRAADCVVRERGLVRLDGTPELRSIPAARAGERLLLPAVGQERHHIRQPETAVAAAANAEEGKLPTITEALHGIYVQVEHLGDFARGEERSELADDHSVPRLISCGRTGR